MEKVIKYSIIILSLIILSIFILIFIFNKVYNKDENIDCEENIDSASFEIVSDTSISKVTVDDVFYNVKNCVQNYIDYINDENYEAIYKILDKNYIDENNITIENLKENITKLEVNKFIASEINGKEENIDISIYFVYGKLVNDEYTVEEEKAFTVIIDNSQSVFAIIPRSLENENYYEYNFNIEYDVQDNYNEYIYEVFTEDKILLEYFNYYKELAVNKPEEAFLLLDEEYKNKRFYDSEEKYIEYLNNINLKNTYLDKYMCDVYDDYKDYVCIDSNGIYYIFKETAPMEFDLKLDTYTIESEKFITEYERASDEEKVMMNIDKWISMIENKDYENSYNLLDKTFRSNNFNIIEEFKKYIKENMSNNYSLEFKEQNYLGEGIYTQVIKLSNDNEEITKTVIIKLEEDRKFVLSFDV